MSDQFFFPDYTVFLFCNFLQREVLQGYKYRVLTEPTTIWYYCERSYAIPLFSSRDYKLCYNFAIRMT